MLRPGAADGIGEHVVAARADGDAILDPLATKAGIGSMMDFEIRGAGDACQFGDAEENVKLTLVAVAFLDGVLPAFFWSWNSCHDRPRLAMPSRALPSPALPSPALPRRAWPCPALPSRALPGPDLPRLTLPCQARPSHTLSNLAGPSRTMPRPRRAAPRHAPPGPAPPSHAMHFYRESTRPASAVLRVLVGNADAKTGRLLRSTRIPDACSIALW